MGDWAEYALEGIICQECGEIIDNHAPGHPRVCAGCKATHEACKPPSSKIPDDWVSLPPRVMVVCPDCRKQVVAMGYAQHRRDKHNDRSYA